MVEYKSQIVAVIQQKIKKYYMNSHLVSANTCFCERLVLMPVK